MLNTRDAVPSHAGIRMYEVTKRIHNYIFGTFHSDCFMEVEEKDISVAALQFCFWYLPDEWATEELGGSRLFANGAK